MSNSPIEVGFVAYRALWQVGCISKLGAQTAQPRRREPIPEVAPGKQPLRELDGKPMPTQQDQFIAKPRPPFTYMGVANLLMPGIRTLATHGDLPAQALPLAMLCAHTLECGLKAFLSRNGDDTHLRKPSIRHNISQLWEEARKDGLPTPMPAWAKVLSEIHDAPYHLRYPKVHVLGTPVAQPMTDELGQILSLIESKLHGSP
jgi:hypothetical protein